MNARSLHAWFFEGVDYHVFQMDGCWYLSATGEQQRHGSVVALEAGAAVVLMSLIDDVKERTERAKRLLGD